ncbi:hypothetical protein [Nitrococcus mobilis]|uniref:Uncharacterized protein n=1 Tax=Nitrococcus mobilis Nb-231 TaxID=314278 RepID=A4BNZ0_9GAMM|nr:hypothetical protein [Nitrococcus mobilis]EAR22939.1 hypothetical protein NB231_10813 [Nitrococcus mobilis Nb-231]
MGSAGEQRVDYWKNRVRPYLRSIWPKSRDLATPTVSENLARLCIAAQEAFPEALEELRHWLQPLQDPDYPVQRLHQAGLCREFPADALTFLNLIIGEGTQWIPDDLANCLKLIRDKKPQLEAGPRFQKLLEYVRRAGQDLT